MVQRYLIGTSATLEGTFYSGTAATDPSPDAATVTVMRANGTVLAAAQPTLDGGTPGSFTFTVPSASNTLLDTLSATWTATINGQDQSITTTAEIVGGFLFGLHDLATLKTGGQATLGAQYTQSELAEARTYAEQELENALGFALVPRYKRVTISASVASLKVGVPFLRAVRDASWSYRGTTAVATAADLSYLDWSGGWVWGLPWSSGRVTLGVEHGMDVGNELASGARNAALIIAKEYIVRGATSDRQLQQPGEFGPISLAIPGGRGGRFGLPEADAFVGANRLPAVA